jgi:hypothetical protein
MFYRLDEKPGIIAEYVKINKKGINENSNVFLIVFSGIL